MFKSLSKVLQLMIKRVVLIRKELRILLSLRSFRVITIEI
jgi:hypothetical protein